MTPQRWTVLAPLRLRIHSMKFILGTKKQMTQVFADDGTVVPVTVIKAEPNTVTVVRGQDKDGYTAVQLGIGTRKESRISKPQRGQWKDMGRFKAVREFRVDDTADMEAGKKIDVSSFAAGDNVQVTGISKGKGFAGVVKRHHFKGGPASHGHKDNLRAPGSIGATFPQHVVKGTRMAGHMGDAKVTVKNLKVVKVDTEAHELWLGGAVPGARNALIMISTI